jgi:hypothetical protein
MRRPFRFPSQQIRARLARIAAATASLLAACAEPPTIPSAPAGAQPRAAVGVVTPPTEASWTQGQLAVQMGSATGRVCFLISVWGRFDGVTESVNVGVSGGKWYLGGSSQSTGVGGRARCVAVNAYSAEVRVNLHAWSGTSLVQTVPLSGVVCGLTGIAGSFATSGSSASARPYPSGWRLSVTVPAYGHVIAQARCVLDPSAATGTVRYWYSPDDPVYLAGSARACILAGIRGPLRGATDWVRVSETSSGWYLAGSLFTSNLSASSTCVG